MEEQELYREETGAYPENVYGRKLKNVQERNRRINREKTEKCTQDNTQRENRRMCRKETGEFTGRKQEHIKGRNRMVYREATGRKQENLQEIIQGGNSRYNGSHMKHVDTIGHVAAAPGPLACPCRGPIAFPSCSAREISWRTIFGHPPSPPSILYMDLTESVLT